MKPSSERRVYGLANDVYGFHAWQSECLRSFQIGLPRVWPRTSAAPAALPRALSHLPGSWLARCRPFPARKSFSRQRVLRPLAGLRLPRRGERSSPVCLHALPAQHSQQQQQQSGPQQIRAHRYVRRSNRAELNCCVINGYKILVCRHAWAQLRSRRANVPGIFLWGNLGLLKFYWDNTNLFFFIEKTTPFTV